MARTRIRAVEPQYDVVIVGGGVTGGVLAKQLVHAGHRVLMLEAGRATSLSAEGYAGYVRNFYAALAKTPDSPYPRNPNAPDPTALQLHRLAPGQIDASGYLLQQGPNSFLSDYRRTLGGTTLHWNGTALRMLPNDFRLKSTYGVGVDWPIRYEDLRPYYERAEYEIGVAGDLGEQRYLERQFGLRYGDYQYPMLGMPQSYMDLRFKAWTRGLKVRMTGCDIEVRALATPMARNATPNPAYVRPWDGRPGYRPVGAVGNPYSGERCEGNASCVPICPAQAKYNALKTIAAIRGAPNFTLITQAVASRVEWDTRSARVTGIRYKIYDSETSPTFTEHVATGRTYVIAAHSIETAKLLLASGVANTSDQLGRNLMDHPLLLTWGIARESIGTLRGPGSTTNVACFRDGPFRSRHSAFIAPLNNWGWQWGKFAPGGPFLALLEERDAHGRPRHLFGKTLRERISHDFPRQFSMEYEFEQPPDPNNRVTVDPDYLDPLRNPRPVIRYRFDDYVLAAAAAAQEVNRQIFKHAGIRNRTEYPANDPGYAEYQGKPLVLRGAGHLVGTHRMGSNPGSSVVDSHLRCWDHPNLFLVGCGSMPTLGTSNPTLTATALSLRAAEAIARDLADHPTTLERPAP